MDEPGRPRPDRPHLVDAAAVLWLVAAATLVTAVVGSALHHVDVRAAVSDSFAADHPAIDRNDTARTVDFIMLGNAAVALLIVAVAVAGIIRVRDRLNSGRTALAVNAAFAVAVGIQFWLVSEPAHEVVGGVISVLPLVMAAFGVIGSALLYPPAVGRWLNAPFLSTELNSSPM